MFINYWDCKYSEAEEVNFSDEDTPDYEWVYHCNHPDNEDKHCHYNNKWCEDQDDCTLLDKEQNETSC